MRRNVDNDKLFYPLKLNDEYEHPIGIVRWCIVTDMNPIELIRIYGKQIRQYKPFTIISKECGEQLKEFRRKEERYKTEVRRHYDFYEFDENLTAIHHPELQVDPVRQRLEQEEHELYLTLLRQGIENLSPIQKRRVIDYYINSKTYREIAEQEGVSIAAVEKSVALSLCKLRDFIEEGIKEYE